MCRSPRPSEKSSSCEKMEIRLKYARNELLFIFLSPIISSPCQSTGVCQKNASYVSIHRVRTRSRTWRGQSKRNFEIEPVKGGKLTLGRASLRRELLTSVRILRWARVSVNGETLIFCEIVLHS